MAILTLAEAKTALNITTTAHDAELPDYIGAAQECVDFLCGPSETVNVTETVRGCVEIPLGTTPVLAVTSVTGQAWGALLMSQLWVNKEAGVIRAKTLSFPILEDYYEVVYTAGRASVPLAIKQGVRIILAHQWDTRRGVGSLRPGAGGDDSTMIPGLGYAIPNRALQILDRYLTGPSVG